jgi:putative two-component system response regulator
MMKPPVDTQSKEMIDTARRMAILAEFRDPTIADHVDRIRGFCRVIARGAGLSPQEVDLISAAAMLHDLGKAGVPFEVLQKSDRLTAEEWEIIKQHTLAGAELLTGSPSIVMQTAEIIALTHHERWDGSGYPHGLKGEAIPLSGRICAVADVFDALTTRRPYKPEMPVDDALALIRSAGGSLFDPQLVRIFVENFDELLRVRSQYL